MNMTDPRCEEIKEETAGMEETAANLHFCLGSQLANEVFSDELAHIDNTGVPLPGFESRGGPSAGNHRHMCKRWLQERSEGPKS